MRQEFNPWNWRNARTWASAVAFFLRMSLVPSRCAPSPSDEGELKSGIAAYSPGEIGAGRRQLEQFLASEAPEHGQGAIEADEAVPREDAAPGDESRIGEPAPADVQDDDPSPGDARHLGDE